MGRLYIYKGQDITNYEWKLKKVLIFGTLILEAHPLVKSIIFILFFTIDHTN